MKNNYLKTLIALASVYYGSSSLVACTLHADCDISEFCNDNRECTTKREKGGDCNDDRMCKSGYCKPDKQGYAKCSNNEYDLYNASPNQGEENDNHDQKEGQTGGSCELHSDCSANKEFCGDNKICTPKKKIGEGCSDDVVCKSNNCKSDSRGNAKCAINENPSYNTDQFYHGESKQEKNEAQQEQEVSHDCNIHADCTPYNQFCNDDKTCVPKRSNGEGCSDDVVCKSNNCQEVDNRRNGKCYPEGVVLGVAL